MNNKSYERISTTLYNIMMKCAEVRGIDIQLKQLAEIVEDEDHPKRKHLTLEFHLGCIDEWHETRKIVVAGIERDASELMKRIADGINETII